MKPTEIGWRAVTGQASYVRHEMIDTTMSRCRKEIVLTDAMLAATPRAFPAPLIKRLRSRPMCGACNRMRLAAARPHGDRARTARIEELEAVLRAITDDPEASAGLRAIARKAVPE